MTVIRYHRKGQFAILESPPTCRSVMVTEAREEAGKLIYDTKRYYLALPWVVLGINYRGVDDGFAILKGVSVAFRNQELTNTDQLLYYPHLYNIYAQPSMPLACCMGRAEKTMGILAGDSFFHKVVAEFWGTSFVCSGPLHGEYVRTDSYSDDPQVALPCKGIAWKSWEEATKKNPSFILQVAWKPAIELFQLLTNNGVMDRRIGGLP